MERIKVYDGQALFDSYKEWFHRLKDATDNLSTAVESISEFCKPLSDTMLRSMMAMDESFWNELDSNSLKWIYEQRPVQREYLSKIVPQLIREVRKSFSAWNEVYKARSTQDKQFPHALRRLSYLEGLFAKCGFTDAWFENQRHSFDEYLETPEELEFYQVMKELADAVNIAGKYAKNWRHKINPIESFLKFDQATESFTPILDGIKTYVSITTP